jgi:hypothetical protein
MLSSVTAFHAGRGEIKGLPVGYPVFPDGSVLCGRRRCPCDVFRLISTSCRIDMKCSGRLYHPCVEQLSYMSSMSAEYTNGLTGLADRSSAGSPGNLSGLATILIPSGRAYKCLALFPAPYMVLTSCSGLIPESSCSG